MGYKGPQVNSDHGNAANTKVRKAPVNTAQGCLRKMNERRANMLMG